MSERIATLLGGWTKLATAHPILVGLGSMIAAVALLAALAAAARARLNSRSDKVAAGPIFALSGFAVMVACLVWWLIDAILVWSGRLALEERLILMALPEGSEGSLFGRAAVEGALRSLQTGHQPLIPGVVLVPLMLVIASTAYVGLVLWVGRTLEEILSLEKKPDDVLAKERAELQKKINQALKAGRPIPTEVASTVPLADDALGRVFKLLGYWTSVERVEPRMLRWQQPLVKALTATSLLALPAALGGHLSAPLWVGTAIALDGLRRNLRSRTAAPARAPEAEEQEAEPVALPPMLGPLIEAVHASAGPLLPAPASFTARGGQLSPGTHLTAKKVLGELSEALGLRGGLYVHQGLACDAFVARKNVLVTTPPLSGKQTLVDLLVFYALLVEAENVLYIAPSAAEATEAERRFRERADAARWRWNVSVANLSGRAGAVDAARAQPGLIFADVGAVHRELCGRREAYGTYLGGLGLVVLPSIDAQHGPRGAHLAHVLRRLRRARALALPLPPPKAADGERVRVIATADPRFRDLGRFAERIVGRAFHIVGPEVDGAPEPARAGFFLAPAPAPGKPWADLEPAVQALGEALARGFAAELFDFDGVLAADDVARANEVMLGRGVATRGLRRDADASERLAKAQVVIARASAGGYTSLSRLASHVGCKAVSVPEARVAALSAGEEVGKAAAPPVPISEPLEANLDPETGEPLPPPPPPAPEPDQVLVLWQPDLDPMSELLAKERPPFFHPDLKLGCTLVADPLADRVQRAHLACALAEGPVDVEDLRRDFSTSTLDAHFGEATLERVRRWDPDEPGAAPLGALTTTTGVGLIVTVGRDLDYASGALRVARRLETRDARAHDGVVLDASGEACAVVDRHSGDELFSIERERAHAAVYPGRIFVHGGRRFVALPPDGQADMVWCEREERALRTSKLRRMRVEPEERRSGEERRGADRPTERRTSPARSIGGAEFTLTTRVVHVTDEVIGLRRHGPDGVECDTSFYDEPIVARYTTRATVFALPQSGFGPVSTGALHALCHLFRVVLPMFVHHTEDDLELTWMESFGSDGCPAIVFVDSHPGGAGFAEAVNVEVLRQVIRWSLALTRRCPRGCHQPSGCPGCVRTLRCHAEHPGDLDKLGADAVLAKLVGEATLASFGPAGPRPLLASRPASAAAPAHEDASVVE